MRRRDALTGALLAAVTPSGALAEPDPHPAWVEEWRGLRARFNALPDETLSCDADKIWKQMIELADRIYDTAPSTPAGMIIQLRFLQEDFAYFEDCYASPDITNRMIDDAVAFIGRA